MQFSPYILVLEGGFLPEAVVEHHYSENETLQQRSNDMLLLRGGLQPYETRRGRGIIYGRLKQ